MPYKHDVFLSYPHGFIEDWVRDHFLPLFRWHLESALGRPVDVFIDRDGISTGDSWPQRLMSALAHSRCLVPVWAPAYFGSDWCVRECCVMLERERSLNYRTAGKPEGLVLPVNVSDGQGFPTYAKVIQYFDCRDYVLVGPRFNNTEAYIEFQLKMKQWAPQVAKAVERAPRWRREWLNGRMLAIPQPEIPAFRQPTLA
jgi:hypothetical protein